MIDLQKAMAEHRGAVRADTTEIYRNIHVDEAVEPSDFAFKVPEGTTLKKSLVEGAFEFPPMTPPSATPPR